MNMTDLRFDEVIHSPTGWNQDTMYFERCVARALFPWQFDNLKGLTERQMRMGGKRVNDLLYSLIAEPKAA